MQGRGRGQDPFSPGSTLHIPLPSPFLEALLFLGLGL